MFTRAYTSTKDDLQAEPFGTRIYFTASSSALARDGMSLRPDRWRLDNYHRSGGPVLWAHKHDMPAIGSGEGKAGSRLRVGVVFDQEDPFAKSVESKVRRKFLRGSSVGWDFVTSDGEVIKNNRAFAASLARDAFYDLSELSIVNVPADPHAVAERHWNALRSIHPGLLELYDAQERTDSDVTESVLRRALIDYCERLGLDLRYIRAAATDDQRGDAGEGADADDKPEDDELGFVTEDQDDTNDDEDVEDEEDGDEGDEPGLVRRSDLPALLRAHGLNPSISDQSETVDERAMKTLLAAFGNHGR